MLVNITSPVVQAANLLEESDASISSEDSSSWNIVKMLDYSNTLNSINDFVDKAEVCPNEPDVGKVEKPNRSLFNWFKNLFSGNCNVKSRGNKTTVYISKDIVDQGISLSQSGKYINLVPSNGNFGIYSVSDCAVRYTDVFPYVDYQFSSCDGKADIKIICKGELSHNCFMFNLKADKDLKIENDGNGYVVFRKNEPLFSITKPIMKDISGANGNAQLLITDKGELVVKTDLEWAKSLNRAYPLSIEFDIKAYEQEMPIVYSKSIIPMSALNSEEFTIKPEMSFNEDTGLMTVSNITIEGSLEAESISYRLEPESGGSTIEEEVSSLPIFIPEDKLEPYKKYKITLIIDGKEVELKDTFLIYEVKNNLQKSGVVNICYRYGGLIDEYQADNGFNDYKWIITSESTVFIRNPEVEDYIAVGNPITDELAQVIRWLFAQGKTNINEYGLEPINYNTGNYVYSALDFTLPDYTNDFNIERTYNAIGAKIQGMFGYGWEFGYDISLTRRTGGTYIMSLGDGRTVWFRKNGSVFKADSDKHYTLAKVSGGYSITDDQSKQVYIFDYYGCLIAIRDICGNTVSFTYDSNNNLKSIKNAAGYAIDVKCDEKGRITKFLLPDGNVISYQYDSSGNLVSVTDQENRITQYTYDSSHRILTVVNPEGKTVVDNTYDSDGRVIKQLDANNNFSTLTYESGKTTVTDNNGNVTQIFYDDQYRTTKVINPDNSVKSKTWDAASNMASETDPSGATTHYEYNSVGLVTKVTRGDGKNASYTYNDQNRITSFTDFAGAKTEYTYDLKGNLTRVIYADGSTIEYTYNDKSQLTQIKDQLGNVTKYEYTGALATAYVDAEGNRTEFGYGQTGKLTAVKDARGNVTRYLYNKCGERYGEQRPDGSQYLYTYDKSGLVTAITDELGYKTVFTYDSQGNMLSGTDPLGNMLTMTYDKNNNKLTSVDALGNTTAYTYDSMNRLTVTKDAKGGLLTYTYDAVGNVVSITDPNGNQAQMDYDKILSVVTSITEPENRTTSFEYDAMGNVTRTTYADGSFQTFEYDSLYRLVKSTSVLGLITQFQYDAAGNLIEASNNEGQKYTYQYDKNGSLTSVTDALGNTTTYVYDELGRVVKTVDAGGFETTVSYDTMGRVIKRVAANGAETTFEYNLRGDNTAIVDANGGRYEMYYNKIGNLIGIKNPLGYVTTYEYDAGENLTAVIDALSNKTSLKFDTLGKLIQIEEANGAKTTLEYDKNGNNTKITDAEGYISEMTYDYADQIVSTLAPTGLIKNFIYDSMCRIVKESDSTGGFIDYTYDAAGNVLTESDALGRIASNKYDKLGRLISETGRDGETYTYAYDALSRVTSMTDPENHVTTYEYDYMGNLTKVEEFDGAAYVYEYDSLGQLIKMTNPIGAVTQYEYDLLGNVIKTTDGNGNETNVDYDALNRIVKVKQANSAETAYTYDAVDNVISVTSPLGNVSEYQYDSVGNLVKYKNSENYVTQYAYDLLGNLTTETSPRNAVTAYEYDGAKNITKITDAEGNITAYDYLPDSVLSTITQANGGKYSYEYDVLDRVTKVTDPEGYFRSFTYNEKGDVTAETDSLEINNTYTYDIMHRMIESAEEGIATKYSYDECGNLAKVVMPNNAAYSYEYDSIGRMEAMTDPLGLTTEYSYDFTNHLVVENKGGTEKTTYIYDSVGNNISVSDPMDGVWKFTYDLENNIVKSTDALGNSATTAYDTIGRAISYTDELGKTTVLAYDPHNNLIGLNDANNQTTAYTYDLVDNLTSVKDGNGSVTSYSYDSMGNVTNATNANGNTTAYTYNLRGDLTSVVTPMSQTEQYKYDIAGKLTEYVKPSGTRIVYDYDKLNNLVKKEAGEETPVTYGYDSMGFRVAMKDETGDVTYSYDAVGNATKVIHHNGDTVTYEYDKFGRLTKIAYPDGDCTSYEYDLNDRLVKVTGRDNGVTTYTYDANGNVTSCTRSNNTKTNYTYNARGDLVLLENVRTNKDNTLLSSYAYEYDNKGYIVKETEKVDSYTYVRDYIYDASGQLIAYTENCSGSVVKYSYTYDGAGNRTGMVYYDASNTKYWTDYVYDANNELVSETYNYNKNKNKVVSEKTTYNYDVDGNLVKKASDTDKKEVWEYFYTAESRLEAVTKGGTLLMAATYDGDNNRIFQISYAGSESKVKQDSSIKSLYTSENGNSYAWEDGNGNGGNGTGHSNTGNGKKNTTTTTNKVHNHTGNNSYGTKHANCKVCSDEAKQSNQDFVQSLADDTVVVAGKELLPIGKENSYKKYELISYINDVTIENVQVLVEYGANGTPTGTYEYGLERLSVEYVNSAKEYYLYSGTGSVVQTSEQNGSLFLRQTYDPFGNSTKIRSPLTVDIDDLNRYTYNGEDYDYNTGLQYLRARYYSTSTGNFISQDTYLGDVITPLSQNRYTYCHNNPVMNDDPSGHLIFPFLAVVAGAYQLYNTYQYAKSEIAEVQDYHKQVDTYTQEMADLAESGKMVELCQYTDLSFLGTEYLPDNVVFNNSANRYVIFDTKEKANLYHSYEQKRSQAARELWSFYGHLSLDVLGLIPGYGAIFDLTNAVWYAAEGDYVNASMSAIAAGLEIASMFKPEAKVAESTLGKYGDEAFDMNKASAKKATDVVDTIPDVCNKNKCFIAGTKVLTVDGLKAIEDIEVGDVVVATDPETGETTEKEVKNTFVNETDELAHVFVDGEEIVCTPGHKFYVPEKGWTSAIELRAGDQLQLVNGEYVTVEAVQHEILEEPVKVYNFEVEDFHTYYVGADVQVLVHNTGCGKTDFVVSENGIVEATGNGQHVLEKHVGLTDQELLTRLNRENISGASTFTNDIIANDVINQALNDPKNISEINTWMSSGAKGNKRIDYHGNTVIGRGVTRGANTISNMTDAAIILKKDNNGGYYILTAYPK